MAIDLGSDPVATLARRVRRVAEQAFWDGVKADLASVQGVLAAMGCALPVHAVGPQKPVAARAGPAASGVGVYIQAPFDFDILAFWAFQTTAFSRN